MDRRRHRQDASERLVGDAFRSAKIANAARFARSKPMSSVAEPEVALVTPGPFQPTKSTAQPPRRSGASALPDRMDLPPASCILSLERVFAHVAAWNTGCTLKRVKWRSEVSRSRLDVALHGGKPSRRRLGA